MRCGAASAQRVGWTYSAKRHSGGARWSAGVVARARVIPGRAWTSPCVQQPPSGRAVARSRCWLASVLQDSSSLYRGHIGLNNWYRRRETHNYNLGSWIIMSATGSPLLALPDDLLTRVLVGFPRDDHGAAAAVTTAASYSSTRTARHLSVLPLARGPPAKPPCPRYPATTIGEMGI